MRKLLFALAIAIIAICSCTTERKPEVFIQPELDSIMMEAVKSHPKDDIFQLVFFPLADKQFFYISCSPGHYYSEYVDDCFEKDGKLFYYYAHKGSWKDSLLNVPKEFSCLDTLKHYCDFSNADVCYDHESYRKCFMILSKEKYKELESPFAIFEIDDTCNEQVFKSIGGRIFKNFSLEDSDDCESDDDEFQEDSDDEFLRKLGVTRTIYNAKRIIKSY